MRNVRNFFLNWAQVIAMHKDSVIRLSRRSFSALPMICKNYNNAAVLHAITTHTFLQVRKSLVMNFEMTFF